MSRESFIIYRSFYESIKELPSDTQLELYDAICRYQFADDVVELSGVAKAIFTLIKPQLDANNKRHDNGCKGGAPKGSSNNPNGRGITKQEPRTNQELTDGYDNKRDESNQELTKQEPRTNQTRTKNKPNENENDNVNDNDKKELSYESKKKEKIVVANATTPSQETAIRANKFTAEVMSFSDRYPSEMLNEFISYWTEPNKSRTKMRFEQQPTWELSRRLATWANRDNKFKPNPPQQNDNNNLTAAQRAIMQLAAENGYSVSEVLYSQ